ncbi:hypothetical protein BJ875DRAFT_487272 [Amylocarpus encephaloides]|uniref:Uncharacterized protein n=1 Tax=Amylocarpus encephaloides TaxID=45428 RepID=A0A9P7YD64_9HELO|nr:hypothetical protein BJ875DRAFT_487272 [Amylocarpus encephaloides]
MAPPIPFATWFFLYKNPESTKYYLEHAVIPSKDARELRLLEFFERIKIQGHMSEYAFFIHAQTTKHLLLLKNDNSILEMWRKHCRRAPVITVYIRVDIDASPAEQRTPSSTASLLARQELVSTEVPDYTVMAEPTPRPAPKICTFPGVYIERSVQTFWSSNELFVAQGFAGFEMIIKEELRKGIPKTEIKLRFLDFVDGSLGARYLTLSKEIWEESLLRDSWGELFAEYWKEAVEQVDLVEGPTVEPPPPGL